MICRRALGGMKRKQDQAQRALAVLALLKAKPGDPGNRQYELMEITARQSVEKTSEAAQFQLELQIEGLRAKSDYLQAIIREKD